MNKYLIACLLFVSACSFDTRSGIWTDKKEIITSNKDITVLFETKEDKQQEFNPDLKISISNLPKINLNEANLTNNTGINNFFEGINNISKFKFSKIEDFNYFEPELIITSNGFIFFDDKGNIINFNENSVINWKTNIYSKVEKKLKPKITLFKSENNLVAFDNISKFYSLDLNSGEILWIKSISNPINSQIKIHEDKIFAVDLNNILRCYSLKNGEELWRYGSGNNFLKSNKRNSIVLKNETVYFNNSLGDISAVNIKDGSLLWQTPTQSSRILENAFSLITSDLVFGEKEIIFSNNRNELYSINSENGKINWKQKINSVIRPVIIENLIFTLSIEGYFYIMEKNSGNILRITKVLNEKKKNISSFMKRSAQDSSAVGILVGEKKTFFTTNNGILFTIDNQIGKTVSSYKIDNDKISRPFIFNDSLLIVKNNSIIKFN